MASTSAAIECHQRDFNLAGPLIEIAAMTATFISRRCVLLGDASSLLRNGQELLEGMPEGSQKAN